MPITIEEAQLTGLMNAIVGNNLSSVKIYHGAKCTTWDLSAKHSDIEKAKEAVLQIDEELSKKYDIRSKP